MIIDILVHVIAGPIWVISWTLPRQVGRDVRKGLHTEII